MVKARIMLNSSAAISMVGTVMDVGRGCGRTQPIALNASSGKCSNFVSC